MRASGRAGRTEQVNIEILVHPYLLPLPILTMYRVILYRHILRRNQPKSVNVGIWRKRKEKKKRWRNGVRDGEIHIHTVRREGLSSPLDRVRKIERAMQHDLTFVVVDATQRADDERASRVYRQYVVYTYNKRARRIVREFSARP